MKKWGILFICLLAVSLCTFASADVPVDAAHFPDPALQEIITNRLDGDHNGILSTGEAAKAGIFSVSNSNVADLTGIEYLTELNTLECFSCKLTSLDLSKNPKLTIVRAQDNQLTEIKFNTALNTLNVSQNLFTALDVSGCANLKSLYCNENHLQELKANGAKSLEYLFLNDNQLTTLDVSGCPALKDLRLQNNLVTKLTVNGAASLTSINASGNQLTALDVSSCPELEVLEANSNKMETLNLRGAAKLKRLSCNNNQLQALDLSTNVSLDTLQCDSNQLTCLNLSGTKVNASLFSCAGNQRKVQLNAANQFDLSKLDAFDAGKSGSWTGGSVSGTLLTWDGSSESISYAYDCGNSCTKTFRLIPVRYVAPAVGETFVHQGIRYQVTGSDTSAVIGLETPGSMSKVNIPAAVVFRETTFKPTEIAAKALKGDKKITSLTLGKNIRSIGTSAFEGCPKLKTVKGGAGIVLIKDKAFKNCKVLAAFTFESRVSKIGSSAFEGCKKLKTIHFKTKKLKKAGIGKNSFKSIYAKATVTCPAAQKENYRKWLLGTGKMPSKAKFK